MAGMTGEIDSFDESVESWRSYQERMEQYFAASKVGDNKKVPVLLSIIGGKCYTILRDLAAPNVPGTKTYKELVDILKAHYDPKPLQIAERFRFHKRDQRAGENVRDFNAAIRKLSQECGFGQVLDEALRDRFVCGFRRTNHKANECKFKDATCHHCNKNGQIQKACLGKRRDKNGLHYVKDDDDENFALLNSVNSPGKTGIIWLHPEVDGKTLSMELGTGSAILVISRATYDRYFAGATLRKSTLQLKTYSGEKLIPEGMTDVSVTLNGRENLDLFVVKNGGPPLFGRSWLRVIKLDWTMIKSLKGKELDPGRPQGPEATDVDLKSKLQARFPVVFKDELGTLKDDANPRFIKARPIPYALKEKVERELDRLVNEGITERVEHSEWATPIVPIPKKDGSVRICGDFKVIVNQLLEVDTYPFSKIEDIFATLAGGK
ncbi:uncharacterized protein K02A2.6-like [Ylistrum balloti]|uniref:uncharacterized protein K02A2.6-like n=1 Tax=Ylistrum balloti TaxID=509963 RepID=UPI002905F31E|nr:uncharacterized protein K02A2.6-like [Ylistrum balloti]